MRVNLHSYGIGREHFRSLGDLWRILRWLDVSWILGDGGKWQAQGKPEPYQSLRK